MVTCLLNDVELALRGVVLAGVGADTASAFAAKIGSALCTFAIDMQPQELAAKESAVAATKKLADDAAVAAAAADATGEDGEGEPPTEPAEGDEPPPPPAPPPPPLRLKEDTSAHVTTAGAAALPGAIPLLGSLPPPLLLEAALHKLNFPFASSAPLRVFVPEDAATGPEADQVVALLAQEGVPLSIWGATCPVTLARGNLASGLAQFGAKWNGRLYLCRGAPELDDFVGSPRGSVTTAPSPPPTLRLAVLAPPLAGGPAASLLLAKEHGLPLVSMANLSILLSRAGDCHVIVM